MDNQSYHNQGFGKSFAVIFFATFLLPVVAMMFIDDTWDRFLKKYGDPIRTECWENSKHERVCRDNNTCTFGRNFCIPEVYRWKSK